MQIFSFYSKSNVCLIIRKLLHNLMLKKFFGIFKLYCSFLEKVTYKVFLPENNVNIHNSIVIKHFLVVKST